MQLINLTPLQLKLCLLNSLNRYGSVKDEQDLIFKHAFSYF